MEVIRPLLRRLRNATATDIRPEVQPPLRATLYSSEQMEQHGKLLASAHVLDGFGSRHHLLKRLGENEQRLLETCNLLTTAVKARSPIPPAGEWLLDNFYLIEEQIRTARRHLPKGYSRELLHLSQGPSRGLPRVYDLALAVISHGDGSVHMEILHRFVAAYQSVTPLTLGELWAIPIMLRLALIENLRRVSVQITTATAHVNAARDWATRMLETAETDPKSLILLIADMARSQPPMVSPFIAELTRRLQGHGAALALPLTWIEQRLAESSLTTEQMVEADNQQQAADQVSISNTITSLRSLGATDWRLFVEALSDVERVLREDIDGVYGAMDFATRDRYRHVIASLARRSPLSETEVARAAIGLAQGNAPDDSVSAHVGFYLVDAGLAQLEQVAQVRISVRQRLQRAIRKRLLVTYLGAIGLLTALVAGGLLAYAHSNGVAGWQLLLLGWLSLLATSQLASALCNWLATLLTTPQRLPRMDFAEGIPPEMRSLVVVPTMLGSVANIEALLEALEVRFLGNQDACLHFGLLTDFTDANEENHAGDELLLHQARTGIEKLNDKYRTSGADRFFLFHRPRCWNPAEGLWIGYERKRGKLAALNALLRGAGRDCFSLVVGNLATLPPVKYVITLDTDTELPRESARQFVATMAHPLNRPRFSATGQRVVGGYGILQPRMAAGLAGASQSLYAQLCGSEPGIDPYTRSVSDVYQDLFGEGSFIGKGIYDVDAFEVSLKDRFPENRILSHDLLEGCYARSGLLSDVQLLENYPASYLADMKRHQRWIRGDWQIANWLLPRVPGRDGRKPGNPLSVLSLWKVFDNLRRSLAHTVLVPLLFVGWFMLPQPWLWTLAVAAIVLIPPLLAAIVDGMRKPEDAHLGQHLAAVLKATGRSFALAGFRIACLPYETLFTLRAIFSATWRLLVSHRGLLEWHISGEDAPQEGNSITVAYRAMWINPVTAIAVAAILAALRPGALAAALPILFLWLAAPGIAGWLSRPRQRKEVILSAEQTLFLHRMARKTWAFFEHFVTAQDNWLPPDNYQEDLDLQGDLDAHKGPDFPQDLESGVATRTSPTNMGLALLANLTAADFGYISNGLLLERTTNTFRTMSALERHRGHFYNWYDTRSLQPLAPRYISAVDSGNLAGHLLTLRRGLLAIPDQPVVCVRLFQGLADTLDLIATAITTGHQASHQAALARLQSLVGAACLSPPTTLPEVYRCVEEIAGLAAVLDPAGDEQAAEWCRAFQRQCRDCLAELNHLAPWLALPTAPGDLGTLVDLGDMPTLRNLLQAIPRWVMAIAARDEPTAEEEGWLTRLRALVILGGERAEQRIVDSERLALEAGNFAEMDYRFLYDRTRRLLAVGYNVDDHRRDTSFYDLLASEARLCNFVAIAQGQLPQQSWFALGRLLTTNGGDAVLLSWSGSMFEYLMPLLVMPSYEGTLLHQTCRAAVARHIAYGNQVSLPWGVSESGFNAVDASLSYRYHAFGVPGLGLKRGLAEDAVVSPYASALALMVAPEAACANLQRLVGAGLEGRFGFYEAIDYTPSRQLRGQAGAIVRSFMAHHQGMVLLSLSHLLLDQPMQRRFEAEPMLQATLLLLQEKIPKVSVTHAAIVDDTEGDVSDLLTPATAVHTPIGPVTLAPEVQLLSNGRYHVMLTNAGGGYSRWKDLAITRWREDSTCDNWGSFVYLRDLASGASWSATHQPTLKQAQSYEAIFSEGRAEYRRRDQDYETYSEIVISPEDDIELRRMRITNRSQTPKTLEITSYGEVVLAPQAADMIQTAFSNLFVQTEIAADRHAILCTRRPRGSDDPTPWMFHTLVAHAGGVSDISYETDRMRFIGRGRTLVAPQAMDDSTALSGSEGSVLDPIVAIRCRIVLEAMQTATIDLVSGAADNREACLALVDKYQDRHLADRVFDLAWTHSGVMLRQLNAGTADAELYRRLAGPLLYANSTLRAGSGLLLHNQRGQSSLWGYAISGDLPIVLLKITDTSQIDLARQVIRCHGYWRLKGLVVDLVIWYEEPVGYRQQLRDQITGLIATGTESRDSDRPGHVFVRAAEQISSEDRVLLQAVARVVLTGGRGSLKEQLNRRVVAEKGMARLLPAGKKYAPAPVRDLPPPELILANGLGGFTADGSEYVITTSGERMTPAPWVNVLANPHFGSVVSESGPAYTWSENAHEFRLTPWSNDAVGAASGEAIYLRDEESGFFWSPTALPSRGSTPYVSRHGFGYSVFEHTEDGICSELWVYVDLEDAVKFSVLKVRNDSGRRRRLSATGYVEWVLGDLRAKTAMHIVTEIDAASGALFARNAYNTEFAERVAFIDVDDVSRVLSGDRNEFLGSTGTLGNPEAMTRTGLSGRLGAALDPCGAIQVPFELADGEGREIIFRLGAGRDLAATRQLAQRLRTPGSARAALEKVRGYWQHTLGAVQIDTPDPALNVMANGWLLYQALACRLWARSGFYQSGGAFGFRDQLQDSMALVHAEPGLVREHLLRCAERQYPEGDVQHWWHPPAGRGVRTRCSDDYLWLPLATCRYVSITGDTSVLDEQAHFLEGRALDDGEESYYSLPERSTESASLYQHCVRAILHGLRFGERGLPLMGSGDWNDGMSLVGIEGRGESVWLGFFLYEVLMDFAALAERRDDSIFAARCQTEAVQLRSNLAAHAWDGDWYRRAWFDDGSPLGSAVNEECAIDSIAQSWSVLSGGGDAERSRLAMDALDRHLVRREDGLIQLFDPPFDKSEMNPGYIKGYVPGVRENGGQYTHAGVWAAMAFAKMGDSRRAWELLALLNPVNHGLTPVSVATYKTEPYVIAADVYAVAPHTGRGGWSWYTGAAGWLYRLIVESLLGLRREGDRLHINPRLPEDWTTYSITYRYGNTPYRIDVVQTRIATQEPGVTVDGADPGDQGIALVDDQGEHVVEVRINRAC